QPRHNAHRSQVAGADLAGLAAPLGAHARRAARRRHACRSRLNHRPPNAPAHPPALRSAPRSAPVITTGADARRPRVSTGASSVAGELPDISWRAPRLLGRSTTVPAVIYDS